MSSKDESVKEWGDAFMDPLPPKKLNSDQNEICSHHTLHCTIFSGYEQPTVAALPASNAVDPNIFFCFF